MKVISYSKKYYLEVLLVAGLILAVCCTYWIYTPSYWQYTKPVTKEFVCLRKNYSPSSYRRNEEFNLLCSHNGKLYYIEVAPTTYYSINEGETISFTMSNKRLELYSDRDVNKNISLVFLLALSIFPCIYVATRVILDTGNSEDSISKFIKILFNTTIIYLVISTIVYFISSSR